MLSLGITSWKGVSCFNGGGVCFLDEGGASLLSAGGAPHGGVGFGGGGFEKKPKMGAGTPPHALQLWETLDSIIKLLSLEQIFVKNKSLRAAPKSQAQFLYF